MELSHLKDIDRNHINGHTLSTSITKSSSLFILYSHAEVLHIHLIGMGRQLIDGIVFYVVRVAITSQLNFRYNVPTTSMNAAPSNKIDK